MKVYKVLFPASKKLYSLNRVNNTAGSVRYVIGKWTLPKYEKSKLFAFDSLKKAMSFSSIWPESVVYEADAKISNERINFSSILYSYYSEEEDFRKFWRNGMSCLDGREIPNGTVFCNAIKITKRINYYESIR